MERKKAAALRFNASEDVAPVVVAKGMGVVAENILKAAKGAEVPVYQDEKLVDQLNRLQLGDAIPYDLYDVVAQVLLFIGHLDKGGADGE